MAQVASQGAAPDRETASRTLGRLLGEHRGARAERLDASPNHLPMSLIALDRLGASPADLGAYAELHRLDTGLLPPPVSPGRVARDDWRDALGDPAMEQAYRAFFETELVRLGCDAMLREYLPDLMVGVGGAGFHPMIRLALGIQQDDESEIVLALAYWATAFLRLGHSQHERQGRLDPRGVLDRVRRDIAVDLDDEPPALETGMAVIGALPDFRPVLHWLWADRTVLPKMAEATLALFAETSSVPALHMLAATHAMRTLSAWFYDPAPALRYHWQAIAAAYLVMGAPALPRPESLKATTVETAPPWAALQQSAIASLDDHIIQAVYSCSEEEAAYAEPLYRVAAARFVARRC